MRLIRLTLLCLSGTIAAACAGNGGPPEFSDAKPLDFTTYEHLYYSHTYSCIWYTGSDDNFHYYSMEHWSYNQDKSDGHLDSRDIYKIPVNQINVSHPIPLTPDQDKWVLIWPTKLNQVQ